MVTMVHFVEAYALNPAIYSAHLKLHPLMVLSVLVVAEHSLGVWGLLLAVPLTVFALDYCIRYPESTVTEARSSLLLGVGGCGEWGRMPLLLVGLLVGGRAVRGEGRGDGREGRGGWRRRLTRRHNPLFPQKTKKTNKQVGAKELEKVLNRSEDEGSGEEERGRPLLP